MKYYQLHQADLQAQICREITDTLPDWFGQPEANEQYIKDARKYDCLVAEDNGKIIALAQIKFVSNEILKQDVADIHWLGMLPEYHRCGIGSELMNYITKHCQTKGYNTLTVETLDPNVKDESYLKTYNFYKKFGFDTFQHFSYDTNQMVRMKKEELLQHQR